MLLISVVNRWSYLQELVGELFSISPVREMVRMPPVQGIEEVRKLPSKSSERTVWFDMVSMQRSIATAIKVRSFVVDVPLPPSKPMLDNFPAHLVPFPDV